MKRTEEITKAALDFSPCMDYKREIFIAGALWADNHPKNFWHSVAEGDLPPKAKNNNRIEYSIQVLLCFDNDNVALGCYDYTYKGWYVGLQNVHPTHWMEIPKLPKKEEL